MEASTTRRRSIEKLSSAGASQEGSAKHVPAPRRRSAPTGKRSIQVKITLCPGAEPWLAVTHAHGTFTVPADVSALELYELARTGVVARKTPAAAQGHTRVSNSLLRRLVDGADVPELAADFPTYKEYTKVARALRRQS